MVLLLGLLVLCLTREISALPLRSQPLLDLSTESIVTSKMAADSAFDACIEADIAGIEELKRKLFSTIADEHRTGNITDIGFGLLEEDWRRLHLLEMKVPNNSLLKSNLVRAFRLLIAAVNQVYVKKTRIVHDHMDISKENAGNQSKNENTTNKVEFNKSKPNIFSKNGFEDDYSNSSDNIAVGSDNEETAFLFSPPPTDTDTLITTQSGHTKTSTEINVYTRITTIIEDYQRVFNLKTSKSSLSSEPITESSKNYPTENKNIGYNINNSLNKRITPGEIQISSLKDMPNIDANKVFDSEIITNSDTISTSENALNTLSTQENDLLIKSDEKPLEIPVVSKGIIKAPYRNLTEKSSGLNTLKGIQDSNTIWDVTNTGQVITTNHNKLIDNSDAPLDGMSNLEKTTQYVERELTSQPQYFSGTVKFNITYDFINIDGLKSNAVTNTPSLSSFSTEDLVSQVYNPNEIQHSVTTDVHDTNVMTSLQPDTYQDNVKDLKVNNNLNTPAVSRTLLYSDQFNAQNNKEKGRYINIQEPKIENSGIATPTLINDKIFEKLPIQVKTKPTVNTGIKTMNELSSDNIEVQSFDDTTEDLKLSHINIRSTTEQLIVNFTEKANIGDELTSSDLTTPMKRTYSGVNGNFNQNEGIINIDSVNQSKGIIPSTDPFTNENYVSDLNKTKLYTPSMHLSTQYNKLRSDGHSTFGINTNIVTIEEPDSKEDLPYVNNNINQVTEDIPDVSDIGMSNSRLSTTRSSLSTNEVNVVTTFPQLSTELITTWTSTPTILHYPNYFDNSIYDTEFDEEKGRKLNFPDSDFAPDMSLKNHHTQPSIVSTAENVTPKESFGYFTLLFNKQPGRKLTRIPINYLNVYPKEPNLYSHEQRNIKGCSSNRNCVRVNNVRYQHMGSPLYRTVIRKPIINSDISNQIVNNSYYLPQQHYLKTVLQ